MNIQFESEISNLRNSSISISDVVSYIESNGVYFGSDWWIGEQGGDLLVYDITQNSYYTFLPGVNKTLWPIWKK